jgi:sugar O-acyltransferase (sialic acid O-acetyltransferase NeuD family)
VLDVVNAINRAQPATLDFLGFLADDEPVGEVLERRGARWLGPVETIAELDVRYVVGVGDPATRRRLGDSLAAHGCEAATLVHPGATIGGDVELAPGVVLAAGSHVTTNCRLGRHTQLNVGAVLSHDARIGECVTFSPGCLVNGNASIADEVFVGTGAVITPGRSVGRSAVIGAGAVVVTDVPAGVAAKGVPARW